MKEIKILECPVHGLTEHALYGDRYRCKKCYIHYGNEKRRKKKEELVKYKGGKCEICGYDRCIEALEFHHIDPNEKEFELSNTRISRSLEELKKEADKCLLLCANCHRELHANEEKKKFDSEKKKYEVRKKPAISKIDKSKAILLLSSGKTQKDIAKELGVSLSTFKRYLLIMEK